MQDNKISFWLFVLVLSIYLLSSAYRIDSGDGETMYKVACSIVNGEKFAIDFEPRTHATYGPGGVLEPVEESRGGDGYGSLGIDGKYYAQYGVGWSLLAAPFCLSGQVVEKFVGWEEPGYLPRVFVMLLNPIVSALSASTLYLLARRNHALKESLFVAIMYATATIAWYYARSAFSEPLVALLLIAAFLSIEKKRWIPAGCALGGMLLTRQTAIILVIPLLIWGALRIGKPDQPARINQYLKLLMPLIAGQSLIFAYNFYRFADPLNSGYIGIRFDHPFLLGLYGQLFSPGKGLFVFNPLTILGVITLVQLSRKDWRAVIIGFSIFQLCFHAVYSQWNGGAGWGPRFLLPIIPFLILPLASVELVKISRIWLRFIWVVLIAGSIVIQMLGVSVNWTRHLQRVYDSSRSPAEYDYRINYAWADSPIIGQLISIRDVINIYRNQELQANLVDTISNVQASRLIDRWSNIVFMLSLNTLDFWFIHASYLGIPGAFTVGWFVICLGMILISGGKIRKVLLVDGINSTVK